MRKEQKPFRVPDEYKCNGCKYLNFHKVLCEHGKEEGVTPMRLCTFINTLGYQAIIRPSDCSAKEQRNPIKNQTVPKVASMAKQR